jgi:hypothetical protein
MNSKFQKLHKRIVEIIHNSPIEEDPSHSEQVWKFVLEIDPNVSEELQIAALAHDIERGVPPRSEKLEGETYGDYKHRHAQRSADITAHLMSQLNYSKKSVDKVQKFIESHEVGGDEETDILRDADSASYFANNISSYLKRNGVERTREKIKFMYDRASVKTKNIIKKLEYSDNVQALIDQVII